WGLGLKRGRVLPIRRVVDAIAAVDRPEAGRPRVLCVDDEPQILESLRDLLWRQFDVRTAGGGAEGLACLGEEPDEYAIVVCDMRMPVMSGSVFLREARDVAPDVTRILLTGHADLEAAVSAVNDGQLFRFLTKPCPRDELLAACIDGLEQHRLKTAERVLLEQTLKGSVKALTDILALVNPAAFGRSVRVREYVARLAAELAVADAWELEVSALLVGLGAVTLPPQTVDKLYAGAGLTPGEQAMVERVPAATRRILEHIPRLEGVIETLDNYHRSYRERGAGRSLPLGSRLLRIALDYDALEAHGMSASTALATLRGRGQVYDPDLLDVFARVVGDDDRRRIVIELPLARLRAGMVLAGDVRGVAGALLIARGFTATDQLIDRLHNLGIGAVREPLLVMADHTRTR
ncbi:MAG: HD domain-containing phosphohydrolase, partial [Solirubrobacteraceae bacterium]